MDLKKTVADICRNYWDDISCDLDDDSFDDDYDFEDCYYASQLFFVCCGEDLEAVGVIVMLAGLPLPWMLRAS